MDIEKDLMQEKDIDEALDKFMQSHLDTIIEASHYLDVAFKAARDHCNYQKCHQALAIVSALISELLKKQMKEVPHVID